MLQEPYKEHTMSKLTCLRLCSLFFFFGLAFVPISQGKIIVKTFHDRNSNGLQETGEELISGLEVTGFDEFGSPYHFNEIETGIFALDGVLFRLRIQVSGYSETVQEGIAGPSSVFFANDGDQFLVPVRTEIEINSQTTNILIPCYDVGAAEKKSTSPGFVSFPYTASGVAQKFGGAGPNPTADAFTEEVGSTWGVAYQGIFQRAFTSAVLKRHVGLGPEGLGGIYMLDYSGANEPVLSLNLDGVTPGVGDPIDLGAINRNIIDGEVDATQPYALSTIEAANRRASYDLDAFDKIGKVGFGDIDLTEDHKQLWMVNLHQRSLVRLDIDKKDVQITAEKLANYKIMELPGIPNTDFVFKRNINTGGNKNLKGSESFTDAYQVAWDKNKYGEGGSPIYKPFVVENTMNPIEKTSEAHLYQTYVRGSNFSYNIPVPKSETYEVVLHFAEPNNFSVGDRLFNVKAESENILTNFDIVAHSGAAHKAMTVKFEVEVTDDVLNLDFVAKFGAKTHEALICGIEVTGKSLMKSGDLRPWGLNFHNGRGYLGVISDAFFSQSRDHLFAYILSFDPNQMMQGFKEEMVFPLAYPRERTSNAHLSDPQSLRTASWLPWTADWETTHIPLENEQLSIQGALLCSYPQPIVSDINFTDDGSMVLTIMDRWAHQTGYLNYSTVLPKRRFIIGYASGDILKGFKQGGTYMLEMQNQDDGNFFRNDDGPSYAGEFFYEENFVADLAHHGEVITGGSGLLPGSNEVVTTVYNPIYTEIPYFEFNGVFSQGLHFYNNDLGTRTRGYLFLDQFAYGKANGLGDIEFAFDMHSGEVGNYVWCDANGNGIQDPTEFGIPGIELVLHDKENSLNILDRTTTLDDGTYVFHNLLPNHGYEIRVNIDQLNALGFSGLTSPLHAGTDSLIDSNADPDMVPGFAIAMFCTDVDGNNRHDIDFGFGGPLALDATKLACEDPMTGCATFDLSVVAACVDSTGLNEVRFYPTFNDADSMITANEITGMIDVCDTDTLLFARVNIVNDTTCFSIAQVNLQEVSTITGLIMYNTIICAGTPFDVLAFLRDQGLRGDATTELFSDMSMSMMITSPYSVPNFPYTIYFDDTLPVAGCGVMGLIQIDSLPSAMVEAGNDTSSCGLTCIDLNALGANFNANGSGASSAVWTSSGMGTFIDDNTFAGARLYCPDSSDMFNGSVTLYLEVTDDPCGRTLQDSVMITIESSLPRIIQVPNDTIPCTHPFVEDQVANDTFPTCYLVVNCNDTVYGTVVDYDLQIGNCIDIVKEIVRTIRIRYDKLEFLCMDTIRVISLDPNLFVCPPLRDSVYCHSGYLKDEQGHPSPWETGYPAIDTIPLWPQPPAACDFLILYEDKVFDGICPTTIHRTWHIKNTCTGFYDTCNQWIMIFDTIGPTIEKDLSKAVLSKPGAFDGIDDQVILIPTNNHDCEAHTYVPPILATDTCSDVKMVKAMLPGITTIFLEYNPTTKKWESHQKIKIPRADTPSMLIYEALDFCHNKTIDTCYFFVKDFTKPVTVCDKGVNVTLIDSIAWVSAEVFDEGSTDNCGISLLLARRSDWITACGVDLCDQRDFYCSTAHHDSLWCAVLERDKHINPVEAYYAKTLKWLCEDGQDCNSLVLAGWWYDLIRAATLDCTDHPYQVNDHYLQKIMNDPTLNCETGDLSVDDICSKLGYGFVGNLPDFAPYYNENSKNPYEIASQIGGGWSKEVPFCCADACQEIMVELLAMDYWCNWSKCWTTVYVEDKTPPKVVCELFDVSISCHSYQTYYQEAINLAQQGEFKLIDSLLGGFDKVRYDAYNNLPAKKPFTYYDLQCDSVLITKDSLHYDEHFGYTWKTYSYYQATYDTLEFERFRGQVADDCGLVCIEEEPWVSIDKCGNGFVKREFKFVGQCSSNGNQHQADTLTRYQTIWIRSDCNITKSMFEVPKDTILYNCGLEYDENGSGNAGGVASPEYTGYPAYVFDNDCRSIGVGYYDKVFRIIEGDQACYKIIRNWCLAD